MSLKARNPGGGDFRPVPSGTHLARCVRLIDLGTQHSEKWDKDQEKVLVCWELPEVPIEEGERAGEPYMISKHYTRSLHEKAVLRQHLESWRGRKFTDEELEEFDLRAILDKPCLISVTHADKNGKTYSNVSAVMALPKSTQCPERINEILALDLDALDMDVFKKLPQWNQDLVKKAAEWRHLFGPDPSYDGDTPNPSGDDIPF